MPVAPSEGCLDALQQPCDRKLGRVGLEDAGLQLGHVEKRLEQLVHGANRRIDTGDEPAALGRVRLTLQLGDE